MFPSLYKNIPNSIKVAFAIGHWALGYTEHGVMLCLSDRQTIASQCTIAQYPIAKATFIDLDI